MAGIKPITEKPIADDIKSDSYVVVIQKGADNQYKVHRASVGKLVAADNVVLKSTDKPDTDASLVQKYGIEYNRPVCVRSRKLDGRKKSAGTQKHGC